MKLARHLSSACLLTACLAHAADPGMASKLGKDLTQVGAEKAASKDGTIPAWSDTVDGPTTGWAWGKRRLDHWRYKGEKPVLTIDASNVDAHAAQLTPGQVALIKQTKGYQMDVYPTHRSCSLPNFVLENTRANVTKAKIGADGWSLADAVLPGVPFPAPSTGIEAMWNFLTRYQGAGTRYEAGYTIVSPRPGSTESIEVKWEQTFYYPWATKGAQAPQDVKGLLNGTYYAYISPVALAGQAVVQRYNFAADTESQYYFTGQRRVRRLPAYAYDAPLIGFENQYPADLSYIFYGAPDRFDWKLVGKKELFVPYNGLASADPDRNIKEVVGPTFPTRDVRRYEMHRVWVVEGTVKAGLRHSTPKKVMYLDEDSWLAVAGEDYDAQGKLWKHKEMFIMPTWEIGACTTGGTSMFYDLQSGRYIFDNTVLGTGKDIRFFPEPTLPAFKDGYFTAENLRAISER